MIKPLVPATYETIDCATIEQEMGTLTSTAFALQLPPGQSARVRHRQVQIDNHLNDVVFLLLQNRAKAKEKSSGKKVASK